MEATYFMGVANAIASVMPLFYIGKVGRKPIFVIGHLAIAVAMLVCGFSIDNQWNTSSLIMIVLIIFAFHMSTGTMCWVYVPEVCIDRAMGVVVAFQALNLTIVVFSFEFMINSALQVHGTFWYFSAINFLATLFCLFFVKETRGLTDL